MVGQILTWTIRDIATRPLTPFLAASMSGYRSLLYPKTWTSAGKLWWFMLCSEPGWPSFPQWSMISVNLWVICFSKGFDKGNIPVGVLKRASCYVNRSRFWLWYSDKKCLKSRFFWLDQNWVLFRFVIPVLYFPSLLFVDACLHGAELMSHQKLYCLNIYKMIIMTAMKRNHY